MVLPLSSPPALFQGTLFCYCQNPTLVAFESSSLAPITATTMDTRNNKCILLGGLSDGLVPVPYTQKLEHACRQADWTLVQPLLSSSYTGFGHGSLERDTEELSVLFQFLMKHRSADRLALVGHSTGCQNIVHFLRHAPQELLEPLKVAVLQAPVSDREHAMMDGASNYQKHLELAKTMVLQKDSGKGGGEEMMPRGAFWAPITAQRYLDLHDYLGADDFFSSDLTNQEMEDRLSHVSKRWKNSSTNNSGHQLLLAAFSGADEYVPDHVDKQVLLQRMCAAMNRHAAAVEQPIVAKPLYLEGANHNLSQGDVDLFIREVQTMLQDALS